jgi:hypothetical protein
LRLLVAAPGNGLHDPGVDRGDQVDGGVQVFLQHARFQRPLDPTITSRFTTATERHRQADERLLSFREPLGALSGGEIFAEVGVSHVRLLFLGMGRLFQSQRLA